MFSNQMGDSKNVDEFDLVSFIPSKSRGEQEPTKDQNLSNLHQQNKEEEQKLKTDIPERKSEIQSLIETRKQVQGKLDQIYKEESKSLSLALENALLVDPQKVAHLVSKALYEALLSNHEQSHTCKDSTELQTALAKYLGVAHSEE